MPRARRRCPWIETPTSPGRATAAFVCPVPVSATVIGGGVGGDRDRCRHAPTTAGSKRARTTHVWALVRTLLVAQSLGAPVSRSNSLAWLPPSVTPVIVTGWVPRVGHRRRLRVRPGRRRCPRPERQRAGAGDSCVEMVPVPVSATVTSSALEADGDRCRHRPRLLSGQSARAGRTSRRLVSVVVVVQSAGRAGQPLELPASLPPSVIAVSVTGTEPLFLTVDVKRGRGPARRCPWTKRQRRRGERQLRLRARCPISATVTAAALDVTVRVAATSRRSTRVKVRAQVARLVRWRVRRGRSAVGGRAGQPLKLARAAAGERDRR